MINPETPPYPRATVRLQFNASFTFAQARELVPYFASMGFSHVYGSPILLARPGSTHGYDIVDHMKLNPEMGSPEDFDAFAESLRKHRMGFIMDFVPNHMGVGGSDNSWWLDVLEWGQSSPYSRFFDIDWNPFEKSLEGKVLLPFLGNQYGSVLDAGELVLTFDDEEGSISVFYHQHRFPIAVRHYAYLIREALHDPEAAGSDAFDAFAELARRAERLGKGSTLPRKQALDHTEARDIKAGIKTLLQTHPELSAAFKRVVGRYNGSPGDPAGFNDLHRLLEKQPYRLSYWRVASNEINYRRFFDINDLAGIRMEDPELFELTHGFMFRLFEEGKIQGIRLDHVDGLYDPADYFERLQNRASYIMARNSVSKNSPAKMRLDQPLYLLVEKILAHHEQLRKSWHVSGTTGYEALNILQEIFNDPEGEEPLTLSYNAFCGDNPDYEDIVLKAKYRIIYDSLASELNVLANRFNRLAKKSRRTRDFSRIGFRTAIADVVAHFPVYRTYVDLHGATDEDRRDISWAVAQARKYTATPDTSIYNFIQEVLTTDLVSRRNGRETRREFAKKEVLDLAMRFQQFTGPVMAKSLEDTTFYRYVRFIARNDVGGNPSRFYTSPQAFHMENRNRLAANPFGMLATATHDHKRGEDARMRLSVLSELPGIWQAFAERMSSLTSLFKSDVDGKPSPSAIDEYLLYQTLAATWPLDLEGPDYQNIDGYTERIAAYQIKAAREAKLSTSWTGVNEEYESSLVRFTEAILNAKRGRIVLKEIESFVSRIAPTGAVNGLSQTLLKLTSPGVPDTYQGCEFWDFSLVDPDNRREVDFGLRQTCMKSWESSLTSPLTGNRDLCRDLVHTWRDGRIKQFVIALVLRLRNRIPDLFAGGSYDPLEIEGDHSQRILAFRREHAGLSLIVAVPRLVAPLMESREVPLPAGWGNTRLHLYGPSETRNSGGQSGLEQAEYIELFSGRSYSSADDLSASELFSDFPAALLFSGGKNGQQLKAPEFSVTKTQEARE